MDHMSGLEAQALMRQMADEAADRAVNRTLLTLGIDPKDPIEAQKDLAALRELRQLFDDPETQKDFLHLRKWRKSLDTVQNKGLMLSVGFMFMGIVSFVIYGIKIKLTGN